MLKADLFNCKKKILAIEELMKSAKKMYVFTYAIRFYKQERASASSPNMTFTTIDQ